MPSAGSSHFYDKCSVAISDLDHVCQCPRRALLISTVWYSSGCICSCSGCQCPRRAILISTKQKSTKLPQKSCVNALGGLFSFLLLVFIIALIVINHSVNALGGLFSFLPKVETLDTNANLGVNALGGLFSFLHEGDYGFMIGPTLCQCPRRALLISTNTIKPSDKILHGGVNALGGLFSFLRKNAQDSRKLEKVCQCPRRALLISTERNKNIRRSVRTLVSMPSAGSSHFYSTPWKPA